MSYLLETLGRGLLGRLADAFRDRFPATDADSVEQLLEKREHAATSADLAIRLGAAYLRDLRLSEAREAFGRALELDPNSRQGAIGLACISDELGDVDEAIRCLSIAFAQDPSDPAIAFAIGYCYERKGDVVAAVANYRHAIELHPYLRNAYERLAAIAVAHGDWSTAIDEYRKLTEVEPEDLDIMVTLATLQLQNGDLAAAADQYQRALLVEPECESTLADADKLTQEGRLFEAVAAVEQLVAKFPGVPDFHVHLGDLYVRSGEQDKAIHEYGKALEYHPNYLEATIKLGTQHLRRGSYVDAARSFAKAAELNDRLITAFVGLGVAQHSSGHAEEAGATFDLAASLEPNSTLLFSETTRLQFKSEAQRRGEFEAMYDDEATAEENRDLLLEALERHEQAVMRKPNHADLHYRHGLLLRQLGRHEQAVRAFEYAVAINPQYTKALIKLGVCLKEMGRTNEAVGVFKRAMTLGMDYVDVHYQLGLLYAQRNRFDLAVEEFSLAADRNSGNISLHANLALALQNIGMIDRAEAAWRAICDISRGPDPVETRRENLLKSLGANP